MWLGSPHFDSPAAEAVEAATADDAAEAPADADEAACLPRQFRRPQTVSPVSTTSPDCVSDVPSVLGPLAKEKLAGKAQELEGRSSETCLASGSACSPASSFLLSSQFNFRISISFC